MSLMLGEDQSFSLSAYVQSPGPQTMALRGYLVSRRNGETWVAPLIPQLFYGVTGVQLGPSWRQYLPAAGEQVILSRSGGYPEVPMEELAWRKVSDHEAEKLEAPPAPGIPWIEIVTGLSFLGLIALAGIVIWSQSRG